MKKLSIEEKAKAYNKAFERAKNIYGASECKDILCTLETIFPELKENEDEKIRKELISFFSELPDAGTFRGIPTSKVIAWLEKRGEQKSTDKVESKFKVGDWVVTSYGKVNQVIAVDEYGDEYTLDDDTYFSGSWKDSYHLWTLSDAKAGDVLNSIRVKATIIFKGWNQDGKHIYAYCALQKGILIKQEMLWDRDFEPATKEQFDQLEKAMAAAGYEWDSEKKELKKIEQEPSIEGSFVNVDEVREDFIQEIYKILVTDPTNDRANQIISAFDNLPTVTIESSEEAMKYLKENHSPSEVSDFQAAMNIAVAKAYDKGKADTIAEMQSPAWSEEDEKMLNDILMCGERHCYLDAGNIAWLKSIKDRVQPQQEWSKEDREQLGRAIYMMEQLDMTKSWDDVYSWLKSLKDRVQPKQEWNEEDSVKIGTLSSIIFDCAFYKDALDVNQDLTGKYAELDNWLQSLPERFNLQPKQEWSEEDEKMFRSLHNIIYVVQDCDCDHQEKRKLSDFLDSLKVRVQPKLQQE